LPKQSAVSQGRADRHADFQHTDMMEAAAKPDLHNGATVLHPAR